MRSLYYYQIRSIRDTETRVGLNRSRLKVCQSYRRLHSLVTLTSVNELKTPIVWDICNTKGSHLFTYIYTEKLHTKEKGLSLKEVKDRRKQMTDHRSFFEGNVHGLTAYFPIIGLLSIRW